MTMQAAEAHPNAPDTGGGDGPSTAAPWVEVRRRVGELEALVGTLGLLQWDQQTYLPKGGAASRGQQLAALTGIFHERVTDPAFGDLLEEARQRGDGSAAERAGLRNLLRRHQRACRVPTPLVRALSEASVAGMSGWMAAREAKDFAPFAPALGRIVHILRETAACQGPAAHPYDNLLEEFDPGSTVAELQPMFSRLGGELSGFIQACAERPGPAPLSLEVDKPGLMALSAEVCAALGFRMDDGRLDESVHPFTCGLHPGDVRLTTHPHPSDLLGTLSGTIHECGHGLYEQGLPAELAGTGVAEAAGTGLHESQSRFWENVIGRSLPFCRWLAPRINARWPHAQVEAEALYRAANRVAPTLIRIHADEATYNLHIIVRFQLELGLFSGELDVADLPGAWDEAYARVLGVRPGDPTEGVLQDIHWSNALFGYFPSYTIGNLYASSFRRKMEEDLPQMWAEVEQGDFSSVLGWLRKNVHQRGHSVDAPQLFRETVGDRDPVADLMGHLRERHGALYGV